MDGFTVFQRDFENSAPAKGLTLVGAFNWVLDRGDYKYIFERRVDGWALVLTDREGTASELHSTASIDSDAKRELMLQAMNGQLNGFIAVRDEEFARRIDEVRSTFAEPRTAVSRR